MLKQAYITYYGTPVMLIYERRPTRTDQTHKQAHIICSGCKHMVLSSAHTHTHTNEKESKGKKRRQIPNIYYLVY